MPTFEPIIPMHQERILRTEEARILTIARNPAFRESAAIQSQLRAFEYAEDIHEIHDVTAKKYEETPNLEYRAKRHTDYALKALHLKLLALQTLDQLTR